MYAYDSPLSYPDMACFFPTPPLKGGVPMDAATQKWMIKCSCLALIVVVLTMIVTN